MWISKQTAQAGKAIGTHTAVGPVTGGSGGTVSVLLAGENREIPMLAPAGMEWRPGTAQPVMVLETEDGERFILGTPGTNGMLNPGEVLLHCGQTVLKLSAAGVEITGKLLLNGRELNAEEE